MMILIINENLEKRFKAMGHLMPFAALKKESLKGLEDRRRK